jgi:NAD-dependent SIR2 family protein deacetylase
MKDTDQSPMTNDQNQKGDRRQKAGEPEEVRTPQVFAAACPANSEHKATRVYKTHGEVRYCVCDDCGKTWKQTGPRASGPKPAKERPAA